MLPEPWVSKIFDHMSSLYGAKFIDLWRGCDLEHVKRTWAEKLGGFQEQPLAIRAALEALDEKPWPPTLPEFLGLCREAARRHGPARPALGFCPSAEDLARSGQAARKASETIQPGQGDPLSWARYPRSQVALGWLVEGARQDSRLRHILAGLVATGIANEKGTLLRNGRRP